MAPLPTELRKDLEKSVIAGREAAERGAAASLQVLAVDADRAFDTMSAEDRAQRNALRARMRALASADNGSAGGPRGFGPLVEEVAYEQWHRMLFARFLAENGLLIHPAHGVAISLDECAELAETEGEPDEWMVAAKFAGTMLPGIFRRDDPAVKVRFAPNDRHDLERILKALPASLFRADDSLGWVYQFWQTKAKDEVNKSGRKVGGRDVAAVTQLFTEHYMVRFLLENSLGAWWAARHPESPLIAEWEYLRWREPEDGRPRVPAAGTFPGWPERAAEVTIIDPCCGSGHFLVAAADMLRKMRMEEEGLSAGEAAESVLRENLFGLELDARCTQLAAFALVFDAWKVGLNTRKTVLPNVACSGIAVSGQLEEWKRLADDDTKLQYTLERLYELFKNAPDLGSLINPAEASPREQLFTTSYEEVGPVLQRALARSGEDPVAQVFGAAAAGTARAGQLLGRTFTLVVTNPPFLTRGKQDDVMRDFCDAHHRNGKQDLSTVFIERCRAFASTGGTYALVTPQNWLFLGTYRGLRECLLKTQTWCFVAALGSNAFTDMNWWAALTSLLILGQSEPRPEQLIHGLDASTTKDRAKKAETLRQGTVLTVDQADQFSNPDSRITMEDLRGARLLEAYAVGLQGVATADYPRFGRRFWEISDRGDAWELEQSTVEATCMFGGKQFLLRWDRGTGELSRSRQARIQGLQAVGKRGVAVSQTGSLPVTIHLGTFFDNNASVILPSEPAHLPAIWAFCSSPEFSKAVRAIDKSLKVTNASLAKVPFDLDRWQKLAEAQYPNGLPEPYSDDPTQWLFKGNVVGSEAPLQVAVARLLGYGWTDQPPDTLDALADADGIACVPALAREKDAAERVRALLAAAYGDAWSPGTLDQLLTDVGYSGKSLEQWLRDGFFEQHCKLFHHRPFIWQIWDGRRDGFSALVNYHRLDGARLQKLAYTYLGSWMERQRDEVSRGVAGAEDRLAAAQELQEKLALILKGQPPYDIYVRWKELHEQPIGWEPDLDDGVRMNIRPFMEAGSLRWKPNIKWGKDRGKNPDGSERLNDLHHTIDEKQGSRQEARVST